MQANLESSYLLSAHRWRYLCLADVTNMRWLSYDSVHNQTRCLCSLFRLCSSWTPVATTLTWRHRDSTRPFVTDEKMICRVFGCAQQQDEQTVPMDVVVYHKSEGMAYLSVIRAEDYL